MGDCKYSCATATETLEWIRAIIHFIKPYSFFWESHVVNFITHRLWEAVDEEWIDSLRNEPVEYLVQIPSGVVQEHWPCSLKKFITTLNSLAFPREQADLKKLLPNMQAASLNTVITQGMNQKKRHEIEALAAVVSSVARDVETHTVIDLGAGQGYLSQVLSFEYQLSVIAIDASSHHGKVTDERAERIKKHYEAKARKSRAFLESKEVNAVVSIGCCYNLLSEEKDNALCGFPISRGVKSTGVHLGRNSRDLACQSADRWKVMEKDASLHNFELHAFRAAFQMLLSRYFPKTLTGSPTIGRQGKALRRQQNNNKMNGLVRKPDFTSGKKHVDTCSFFEKFCQSGLHRLNLNQSHHIDFAGIWKEAEPFAEMIGSYWSLRAALGPVLETLILLDRLLFLQEHRDTVEAVMIPIFNPNISPRNVALIAKKI